MGKSTHLTCLDGGISGGDGGSWCWVRPGSLWTLPCASPDMAKKCMNQPFTVLFI